MVFPDILAPAIAEELAELAEELAEELAVTVAVITEMAVTERMEFPAKVVLTAPAITKTMQVVAVAVAH